MSLFDMFDPVSEEMIKVSQQRSFREVTGFPEVIIGAFKEEIFHALEQVCPAEVICSLRGGRTIPVYRLHWRGRNIGIFHSLMGGAGTVCLMESLIARGAKTFLYYGNCGVLNKEIAAGHLILPTSAYRDEGTSYHYLPVSDYVEIPTQPHLAKIKLNKEKKRISELDTIIKKLYESFAVGRITGERFDSLLAEYEAEQKALTASVSEMEMQMSAFAEDTDRAKQFLALARKYTDFSELTTPMINEFVEKIIEHAPEKIDGDRVQEVEIHLRFIGRFELPVTELTEEEIKRQEQLKRHRIKSRERYQKIKAGEHAVGQSFMLTCKCCGQEFSSKRTNTLFCGPNCRSKFYRQEAAESRSRECTCENCGKVFTTTRSDVKYCSDDCRYQAQIKRQGARKKALREAKIEPALPEKETKTA